VVERQVPIKSVDQTTAQMLMGLRGSLIERRTKVSNTIRGHAAPHAHFHPPALTGPPDRPTVHIIRRSKQTAGRNGRNREDAMSKSRFVVTLLAMAALAAPAAAQTVDGPSINWRLATWGKPRANTKAMDALKAHVEAQTGRRFTITIGYESFGGPKELLDLVKVEAVEAALICGSYYPEKLPGYSVMDLPFLPLASFDKQQRVHEELHRHPAIQKELAGWNARVWLSSVLPQYEFLGKGKPPRTLEDFKGMRVRAIGGLGDAMRKLGATPTSMDATEVYTALDRGAVDAVSFPYSFAHGAYKTYEVAKWATENMALGTVACPIVVSASAFGRLPPQYQALFESAKPIAYATLKQAYAEADAKYIPEFRKRGLTFIRFSEDELKQFRKVAAEPVWEDWVKSREAHGIPGRELLKSLLDAAIRLAGS
jgi:TRAP-type C4-dicarboxylate transport system substrate-binding protein